jgi:hypothetical protein
MNTIRRAGALAGAIVAASLILTGCSVLGELFQGQPDRDEDGAITESGQLDVFTLAVGDCIDDSVDEQEVTSVAAVPCEEPHLFEAYHEYRFEDGEYPGADAVDEEAWAACQDAFEGFVGLPWEESELIGTYYTPTEDSWTNMDDRLVTCLVGEDGTKVTGTLEGAQR